MGVAENGHVFLKPRLPRHERWITTVSWSPYDNQLLTCGLAEVIKLWDVHTGECLREYSKKGFSFTSCGWVPDTKVMVSGAVDGTIQFWDVDGRELEDWWLGQTIFPFSWNFGLTITTDWNTMISFFNRNTILIADTEANSPRKLKEDEIASFSLSADNKFLLVNLYNQKMMHLWSIEGDFNVVSKYEGPECARFIFSSCFGGCEEAFIAGGGGDSKVYIWNKRTAKIIKVLTGHKGAV